MTNGEPRASTSGITAPVLMSASLTLCTMMGLEVRVGRMAREIVGPGREPARTRREQVLHAWSPCVPRS